MKMRLSAMKAAAIIAEYNPFHTGHQYHIEQTRRLTGADYILVIMSGNYVQRGAPAFLNKYLRARMALLGGADAVIELPALYAVSSAEYFAQGAVFLAHHLGVVDILSFGSEEGSVAPLMNAASALLSEKEQYKDDLCRFLKQGLSYPAARERALLKTSGSSPDTLTRVLSAPNNILGLEYCKALCALNSSIIPFTISRQGSGFHETMLHDSSRIFPSATAIRSFFANNYNSCASTEECRTALNQVLPFIPESCRFILSEAVNAKTYLTEDDLSPFLHHQLLINQNNGFQSYLDCTPDLSDKIIKKLPEFTGYSDFCNLLKSKDLTYSRISRVLLHILLEMKAPAFYQTPYSSREYFIPYAHLLGFRKSSSPLLSAIKKHSDIPLVTKLADAKNTFTDDALSFLDKELLYSAIYEAAMKSKNKKTTLNELRQSPVIIP